MLPVHHFIPQDGKRNAPETFPPEVNNPLLAHIGSDDDHRAESAVADGKTISEPLRTSGRRGSSLILCVPPLVLIAATLSFQKIYDRVLSVDAVETLTLLLFGKILVVTGLLCFMATELIFMARWIRRNWNAGRNQTTFLPIRPLWVQAMSLALMIVVIALYFGVEATLLASAGCVTGMAIHAVFHMIHKKFQGKRRTLSHVTHILEYLMFVIAVYALMSLSMRYGMFSVIAGTMTMGQALASMLLTCGAYCMAETFCRIWSSVPRRSNIR